ncbi:hypothetical protein [Vibrio cincinnatiensis]|uniref:hypothetical protein n=1 Tax=Vibrio cincinnatiensis TaxID=675 RepID=UPI001EDDE5BE|nr:hypothetical protein [Vibrio cincinnatiensis]MCG3727674.1 hypothetical protein [Vibrio cincinnatiensis]MCG3734536.1 hypothetical protein [Vibrio cincinnatiensis]MCG3741634.1 hypothetical protein [Vibrio cincinnatiensis]
MVNTGNIKNNNLELLGQELIKLGIPRNYYSLGREKNERMCVIEENGVWLVFYFEKGSREDLYTFSDFLEMKNFLVNELIK